MLGRRAFALRLFGGFRGSGFLLLTLLGGGLRTLLFALALALKLFDAPLLLLELGLTRTVRLGAGLFSGVDPFAGRIQGRRVDHFGLDRLAGRAHRLVLPQVDAHRQQQNQGNVGQHRPEQGAGQTAARAAPFRHALSRQPG